MKRSGTISVQRLVVPRCVAVVLFIFVFYDMGQASAVCFVDENNIRTCGVSAPSGHGVRALVGRMGNEWIGYEDATTGECLWWDQIGGASGFWNDTIVEGTVDSDWIATVGSPSEEVCGVALDPPVTDGAHTLTLSAYAGGFDYLLSYGGNFNTTLDCSQADGCYFELWGGGNILGSPRSDYVVKQGSAGGFGWTFNTGEGSDMIRNYSAFPPTTGDCGDGDSDDYDGPSATLISCEH